MAKLLRLFNSSAVTMLLTGVALLLPGFAFAGTWTPVAQPAPSDVNLMLMLSDGTVMAANTGGVDWYRLTPDGAGSYVNGTWTILAPMHDSRLYYSSAVLMDGRVFVAGGEYGTGGPHAEVYDPVTNVWTQADPPSTLLNAAHGNSFYDSDCKILANGSVLISPVIPRTSGIALVYNPTNNTWINAGRYVRGSYQDEASWVKLPDDSILTIDPFGSNSERYIPATNTWVNDGIVPTSLYDPYGSELGAALLLADGRAFFLGSTGHTALYTPTGNTTPGTWAAGPDIPDAHGTPDAPAAMMVDGTILCSVSPVPTSGDHFPSPTTLYVFDPVANSFTPIDGPEGPALDEPTYVGAMLDLPDGNVLFSHMTNQIYIYHPDGAPLVAGKPSITNITANGDGSYHLVGTGLDGFCEGASYGDDLQMDSNYPLVRFVDSLGGVYYGRTYDWSRSSVRTGAAPVSTEFVPSASMGFGAFSLVVVANGIASDPVSFVVCSVSGDMNVDGVVSGLDIQPFVDCLLSGGCFGCADLTNGGVDADIAAFVNALLAG